MHRHHHEGIRHPPRGRGSRVRCLLDHEEDGAGSSGAPLSATLRSRIPATRNGGVGRDAADEDALR